VHPAVGLAAEPGGQVEQDDGEPVRSVGHRVAALHRVRVVPPARDHVAVGVPGPRVVVQERGELVVRHDQRPHRADGPHRGVTVPAGLARDLPDEVAVPAQGERQLVPVGRRRENLCQAVYQDEHMSGRLALDAHPRAGREDADPAEVGQDGLFLVCEQGPEALGGTYLVRVHITVAGLRCRPGGHDRYWFYDEPSGFR